MPLGAAGAILWYAVHRFFDPSPLQALDLGLAVSLGASLINLVVARILLRVGREHRSIILEADGKHLMSDVYTSAAVLIAMGVVRLTGREVLDPLIAILMSGYIVWAAADLIWRSFNGLMDHALSDAEQEKMRTIIEGNLEPEMDYHALENAPGGLATFCRFSPPRTWRAERGPAHAVGAALKTPSARHCRASRSRCISSRSRSASRTRTANCCPSNAPHGGSASGRRSRQAATRSIEMETTAFWITFG